MEKFPPNHQEVTDYRASPLETREYLNCPASEVFASEDSVKDTVLAALSSGHSQVTEVPRETTDSDLFVLVDLDIQDIELNKLPANDITSGDMLYKPFADWPFKNPEAMATKEAEAITETVIEHEVAQLWYLNEPKLEVLIREGTISQAFELSMGEQTIPILNFSETLINEEQLEQIRSSVEKVANVSGGSVFKGANSICVLPESEFDEKTCGSTRGSSGAVLLNERLLKGEFEEDLHNDAFKDIPCSALEIVATHELGHLVELQNKNYKIGYAEAVGWDTVGGAITDDYGNVVTHYIHQLKAVPGESRVVSNESDYVTVNTLERFGKHAYIDGKPVTQYAYTNEREDFAEAFVLFAQGHQQLMDAIRVNAIRNVLREGSGGEFGPHIVKSRALRLKDLNFGRINPQTRYKAKITYKLNALNPDKTLPADGWDNFNYTDIVDDYGNVINSRQRKPNMY